MTTRHRWPEGPVAQPETCSREGCGVQRRFRRRPAKLSPGYRASYATTVEEYSLDNGATWCELAQLGGRVPECKGKPDKPVLRDQAEAFQAAQALANQERKTANIYRLLGKGNRTRGWQVQLREEGRPERAELWESVWPEERS